MKKIFIRLFAISLLSCNGQDNSTNSKSTTEPHSIASFTKEIPDKGNSIFYKLKKQKERQLNLDSLEAGFDSLQIRVWCDHALTSNRNLFVLKRTNNKWTGEFYEIEATWDANTISETINSKTVRNVIPNAGWDKFTSDLLDLKITTLPNMDDIPGLQDNSTDGVMYTVEVATQTQYRYYSYHTAYRFEDKFWQAKNMIKIWEVILSQSNK